MSSFTFGIRSSSAFVRSCGIVLGVLGICGLLASDASANCSNFATKAVTAASQARGAVSSQSAAITAALAAVPDFKEKGNDASITGLWHTVVVDGDMMDQAFETFTSDGNELMIDTTPPAQDNVCNGVWANVGHRKYRIKHPSWTFDANGSLTGTAVFRTDLILNKNGNQFTGHTWVFVYDLNGNLLFQTMEPLNLTGSRITVD